MIPRNSYPRSETICRRLTFFYKTSRFPIRCPTLIHTLFTCRTEPASRYRGGAGFHPALHACVHICPIESSWENDVQPARSGTCSTIVALRSCPLTAPHPLQPTFTDDSRMRKDAERWLWFSRRPPTIRLYHSLLERDLQQCSCMSLVRCVTMCFSYDVYCFVAPSFQFLLS